MRLEGSRDGRRNAKHLRERMTPPEIGLWLALRKNPHGRAFASSMRPAPMSSTSVRARDACDRSGWRSACARRPPARDATRDAWLAEQGVKVLRYPASEVLGQSRRRRQPDTGRRSQASGRPSQADRRPPPPSRCARHLPLAGEGFNGRLPLPPEPDHVARALPLLRARTATSSTWNPVSFSRRAKALSGAADQTARMPPGLSASPALLLQPARRIEPVVGVRRVSPSGPLSTSSRIAS